MGRRCTLNVSEMTTSIEEFDLIIVGSGSGNMIPDFLGDLTELEELNLSENVFTDDIPDELAMLENLDVLNLADNDLTGELPEELGELEELEELDVSDNSLVGIVPEVLGELTFGLPTMSRARPARSETFDFSSSIVGFGATASGMSDVIFLPNGQASSRSRRL